MYNSYKHLAHVKKYYKNGLQRLHTVGGGEYKNFEGTDQRETCPDTPQQNPFSKRMIRTLVEPVRVMVKQAS